MPDLSDPASSVPAPASRAPDAPQPPTELLIQKYEAAFCIVMAAFVFLWELNGSLIFPHILYLLEVLLGVNLAAVWLLKRWPSHKFIGAAVVSINMATVTGILAYSGGIGSNFWVIYLLPIYTSCLLLDGASVAWITAGAISFNVAYYAVSIGAWGPVAYFELGIKCATLLFTAVSTWTIVKRGKQSRREAEESRAEAESHYSRLWKIQHSLDLGDDVAPLYQQLISQSKDAITIVDPDSARFLYVNDACCRSFGYAKDELLRMRVFEVTDLYPTLEAWRSHVQRMRAEGPVTFEAVVKKKGGGSSFQEVSVKLVRQGEREYDIALLRDITERKAAETRLAVQYQITEILARAASIGEAAPEILKTVGEALKWLAGSLWIADQGHDVLKCAEFWQAGALRAPEFEAITRRTSLDHGVDLPGRVWSSGQALWIEDVSKEDLGPRAYCAAQNGLRAAAAAPLACSSRVAGVIEYFLGDAREADPGVLGLIETVGRQIGQFIEKKGVEGRLLLSQEQLRQSQKMEAIGQLAGGVAHEFNNILTSIIGLSQLQMSVLKPGDPVRADFEEIKKAGERGAALTSRLLAFGRRQVVQPHDVDLSRVVTATKDLLDKLVGEHFTIKASLAPSLGFMRGDEGQIEQILTLLIVNASEAMPQGGLISIATENADVREAMTLRHDVLPPGSYVSLSVADEGRGMSPEVLTHLFEPFFSTKPRGRSSGLGLSTVYGIVKQNGGFIAVESAEGKGARFTAYFPRVAAQPRAGASAGGGSKRTSLPSILLVEDEDSVRALARRILVRDGFDLLEAAGGERAIDLARARDGALDLLITDVVMPGLNGRQVAERLRERQPALKVIYMSGYTDQALIEGELSKPGVFFLQKPFDVTTFSRMVRQVLEG